MLNSQTEIYGVLGYPVKHSLSPSFHNSALRHLGINAVYLAFEVAPSNLSDAINGIQSLGIQGCNLTVPHKTKVIPLLDQISPEAQIIGAVNTVSLDKNRHLTGYNTDGIGFLRSLNALNCKVLKQKVLILGAGGSTRAIAYTLAKSMVSQITIVNRTVQKAENLAEEFAPLFPEVFFEGKKIEDLQGQSFDLVVNTTTVGMDGQSSILDLKQLSQVGSVVDIIYTPAKTPLMKQAERLKIPTINGIGMLLHQGAKSFEIWTKQSAPIDIMQNALLQQLSQRKI